MIENLFPATGLTGLRNFKRIAMKLSDNDPIIRRLKILALDERFIVSSRRNSRCWQEVFYARPGNPRTCQQTTNFFP